MHRSLVRGGAAALVALASVGAAACTPDPGPTDPPGPLEPALLGRYTTGLGNLSGETVAYANGRMFVTNTAGGGSLDIVKVTDPTDP